MKMKNANTVPAKLGIDSIIKEWIVSLPYNNYTFPNEIHDINYVEEGNIFLYFEHS